jgi:hypothetical protein
VAAAAEAAERRAISEVLGAFDAAGIGALLLKGAALSYTVYPLPWLRARSDVDLLVRPGAIARVEQVLAGIGYSAAREVSHPLITQQRHFSRTRGLHVVLDVHEALANPLVLRTLPDFGLLEHRAQAVTGLPVAAKALGTADALLHALVHRVAHHNSSVDLLWLYDMHLLVGRMSQADWNILADTAERSRVCQISVDGLRILAGTLHTHIPHEVLQRLASVRREPSAALLGGALTEWRLQWINLKSVRGVRTRLELLRAHLLPPPSELQTPARAGWRLPVRYAVRAVRGSRKWWQPISSAR